jgi:hypothetical protein
MALSSGLVPFPKHPGGHLEPYLLSKSALISNASSLVNESFSKASLILPIMAL